MVAWCLQHRDAKGADSDTKPGHVIPVQAAGGFFDAVPFDTTQRTHPANRSRPKPGDPLHPLAAGAHAPCIAFHPTQDPIFSTDGIAVAAHMHVRRLTPVECERLQGFADNHTRIVWKGKPPEQCPDGPRYRALGNSMAVPVVRWIGVKLAERIALAASRRAH